MTGKDVVNLCHYYGLNVVDNGTHSKNDAFKSSDVVILASKPTEHPYQCCTEYKRDECSTTVDCWELNKNPTISKVSIWSNLSMDVHY